ncbi:MAG TPA: hypothetical protein VHX39_09285 [Acetobacteraceae bacterium]|nr:hypothetical protein [Acetobacteraceae bacterium]
MMIDVLDTEYVAQQPSIALCMDNHADRLRPLAGSQKPISAGTKVAIAVEGADGSKRRNDPTGDKAEPDRGPVHRVLTQNGMKRNGHRGSGGYQFAKAAQDLPRGAAQCTIFELYIDAVKFAQTCGDFLDVLIGEPLDAFVRGAQQVLIQVEDGHLGMRTKLLFQCPSVTGDATHLIISTDDRKTKRTGSRRSGSIEQARPP